MCYNAYPLFFVSFFAMLRMTFWFGAHFDTLSFYTAGKLFPLILRYKSNAYTSVIPEM